MKADAERHRSGNLHEEPAEFLVRNLQRHVQVDVSALHVFLNRVIGEAQPNAESVTLALVSDARMRTLNRFFCGKDSSTDVLSFAAGDTFAPGAAPYLGDIVISMETAERQAESRGTDLLREVKVLVIHGFLHLLGYDHEKDDGEMKRVEYRLRRRLSVTGATSISHSRKKK